MATITFENGIKVNFQGTPTAQDIEEVAKKLGIRKSRLAEYQADAKLAEQEANTSMTKRFLSELPKQAVNVALKNPARFVTSAALAPVDIVRGAMGKNPLDYKIPFAGETFQSEAGRTAGEIVEGNKSLGSALKPFYEVPLAAQETVGAGEAIKGLPRLFKSSTQLAKNALSNRSERKAIQEALEITRPKLTPKEQVKAFEAGRGQRVGLKRTIKAGATNRDIDVAEASAGIVKKGDDFKNIERLQDAINESTDKVRNGLQSSNAIWNKNELKSYITRIKKPITVKSDVTLSRQADNFNSAILELAEQQSKKTEGILDLRQKFDDLVAAEFPNLYDREMTPMRLYIRALRDSLNDFAEAKIPNGLLPDGQSYKEALRFQHLLIKAKEQIAEKAPRVGTTALQRFFKGHPLIAKGVGVAGGAAFGAAVGTPIYRAISGE